MQEMPDILLRWSNIDWETGGRVLNTDTPDDVKEIAFEFEREFFKKTGRRVFTNIDI